MHAPGFYLHFEPGNVLAAAGIWHPARPELERVRKAMDEHPERWTRMRDRVERAGWHFGGESLKRIPRGFEQEHPLANDLRRKDYIVSVPLDEEEVCRPDFRDRYIETCRSAAPLPAYLCGVLGLTW